MANFAGDFSGMYGCSATLFATSTGVSTDANAAGVSVDLSSNGAGIVTAILVVGNAAGTSPTGNFKMQESTDGSNNWTDVTGGAFTQVTTSNQVQPIGIKPTKRYVRCTGTVGGTSPVLETTVLVGPFPLRTAPANDGGFDTSAAAG
jgi:hypothetical protein